MMEKLLNPKGIIEIFIFVMTVVVVIMMLNGIQDSPLGENEQANKTIQEAKKSIFVLTNGYFLAGTISSVLVLIGFFYWSYHKHNRY